MQIQLPDEDAEIGPVPTGGGHKPEPELDRLSNILKTFNDQFGNIPWTDADRVHAPRRQDNPDPGGQRAICLSHLGRRIMIYSIHHTEAQAT